jgi:glycosyltransferase involved in cell wall biosynthesis
MQSLSVFVTTYNNADTLDACLTSVAFADEVLVLDSFSTDATPEICDRHGVRFVQHAFLGYGRQKQLALEHTVHEWVLFLDADEMVSEALAGEINALRASASLGAAKMCGYTMPRNEQVFWRMSSAYTRKNAYLRLFYREVGHFDDMPVHATVRVNGKVGALRGQFFHFGETDIHAKVAKVNAYSTGLVKDKLRKKQRASPWVMMLYPPLFFVRSFFFKRGFSNGWAGFIASVVGSFYVFMKYAKLYEQACFERDGARHMPDGAPAMRSPMERYDQPV